jgi:hypothetical protein
MKFKFLIISLFISVVVKAQKVQDNILLQALCYDHPNKYPSTFVLTLINKSVQLVEFPADIISAPRNSNSNKVAVLYEILLCNISDTIDISNIVRLNIDSFKKNKVEKQPLLPGAVKSFECEIFMASEYFTEPGVYKVRFIMKKESFSPKLENDLSSDWLYFNINSK